MRADVADVSPRPRPRPPRRRRRAAARTVKAAPSSARADSSAAENGAVACSPNLAVANPSSCSLVRTASSVSTSTSRPAQRRPARRRPARRSGRAAAPDRAVSRQRGGGLRSRPRRAGDRATGCSVPAWRHRRRPARPRQSDGSQHERGDDLECALSPRRFPGQRTYPTQSVLHTRRVAVRKGQKP